MCNEFSSNDIKVTIEHIQKIHNPNDFGDFEETDSEAEVNLGESSESDESSGEESSEVQSVYESGEEKASTTIRKRKKHKPKDTIETANGKLIVANFTFGEQSLVSYLNKLNRRFIDNYWKVELLTNIMPSKVSSKIKAHFLIESLNYSSKSVKFHNKSIDTYSPNEKLFNVKEAHQLKATEILQEEQTTTLFCGGSVAAFDWAPVKEESEMDFLAVACNNHNDSKDLTARLEKTSKSIIQIYELRYNKNSIDECQLSYIFTIDEGPIWSIKFHPSQSSLKKRIGLLAVTTANQNILIFSLPFLHGNHSLSLQLQPQLICKLDSSDILFKDQYLYQATALNWMIDHSKETILGAGYVSGAFAIWKIHENDKHHVYPIHFVQSHLEAIRSIDFKIACDDSYHLLTTSHDRKIKTYHVQDYFINETSNLNLLTKINAAEWFRHWPSYMMMRDYSINGTKVIYQQPLEFSLKNCISLMTQDFSMNCLSINDWDNSILMITDTGVVISMHPEQLFDVRYTDQWQSNIVSFTNFEPVANSESGEEIGLVFCDLKVSRNETKKNNSNEINCKQFIFQFL